MIPITLQQDTAHQLTFAHKPFGGWIAAAVAGGIYAALLHLAGGWRDFISSNAGLFATFACGSVFGVGVFAESWRHRLTIYRRHRRWVRERGLWPMIQRTEGAIGDSVRVVLERKSRHRQETGPENVYPVTLELGGGIQPVPLGVGRARVLGERLMVEMAQKLEVSAVDRTGPRDVAKTHDQLVMPPDPHAPQ